MHNYHGRISQSNILIVDDNADMRDYLTRILRQRWEVETGQMVLTL